MKKNSVLVHAELVVMLIQEKIISNKLIKSGEVIIMPKIIICSWIKSGG